MVGKGSGSGGLLVLRWCVSGCCVYSKSQGALLPIGKRPLEHLHLYSERVWGTSSSVRR